MPTPMNPSTVLEEQKLHEVVHAILHDLNSVSDELADDATMEEKRIKQSLLTCSSYLSLLEMKTVIDETITLNSDIIKLPSINPLVVFIEKRTTTVQALKKLRNSMEKHTRNCRISSTVGNSVSIIGGTLCFFFPMVGVPLLIAGSATTLGTNVTGNMIEKKWQRKCAHMLEEDLLAMESCESNLKDIATSLVTMYSLGYPVSKAGVEFLQVTQAIQATSTLGAWSQLIRQLPLMASALTTGTQTVSAISNRMIGVSVIISVTDLIQTWVSKNVTLEFIDRDIDLLEQQLIDLKNIVRMYNAVCEE